MQIYNYSARGSEQRLPNKSAYYARLEAAIWSDTVCRSSTNRAAILYPSFRISIARAGALRIFGLIAPGHWYVLAFAFWMFLLAGCLYFVLLRWRSQQAAFAYLLYLVVGAGWMFGARFDLFPASLTLFALICTVKKRWNCAFALLALATLLKVYPAALLVPFALTLQRGNRGPLVCLAQMATASDFGGNMSACHGCSCDHSMWQEPWLPWTILSNDQSKWSHCQLQFSG